LLIKAIRQTDPDLRMPPSAKLTEAQIAVLETWVKSGAPFPATAAGAAAAVSAAGVACASRNDENASATTSKRSPAQHLFMHVFFMIVFNLLSQK